MSRKLFGTDGIRGRANIFPVTPEIAMKAGMAAGRIFTRGDHLHRVVIGKDTRLSGYMIESALVAGFTSVGMDVFQFGPLPTPAVAMLTRSLRADLGVMISASHNHFEDNGIKFFGPDGQKLSDDHEMQIEALMENGLEDGLAKPRKIGRAKRIDDAQARYIEFAKRTFPKQLTLDGLRVVIDCAHGAAYKVAPGDPVGAGRGSDRHRRRAERPQHQQRMRLDEPRSHAAQGARAQGRFRHRARRRRRSRGDGRRRRQSHRRRSDPGAHRAVLVEDGQAQGLGVVGTVMSNAGLERFLKTLDLKLGRAAVGDRYVVEMMNKGSYNVGGEQSGHIILNDFGTTGDGIVAALQVLAVLAEDNKPASEAAHVFDPLPQVLENVRFRNGSPLTDARVTERIKAGEARLNGTGRILVRKSGTEPVIRVMAEGEDESVVREVVHDIVSSIEEATT